MRPGWSWWRRRFWRLRGFWRLREIEADAAIAIGVAGVEEAHVLGAEFFARERAVVVEVGLFRVGDQHHEHRRMWRLRGFRRRHQHHVIFFIFAMLVIIIAVAADNEDASLTVAALHEAFDMTFSSVGFAFCALRFPLRLFGCALGIALSALRCTMRFTYGPLNLDAGFGVELAAADYANMIIAIVVAHALGVNADVTLGAVLCVETAVVVAVHFVEDAVRGARCFGARHPAIAVGVDVDFRATVVTDDDARRRGRRRQRDRRKRHARRECEFHHGYPLEGPDRARTQGGPWRCYVSPVRQPLKQWRNEAPVLLRLNGGPRAVPSA